MPASVLIADSSSAMRAVIERAIRVGGLPVSGCYHAAHADDVLRLCASHAIDFLLLDTHLGGIEEDNFLRTLSEGGERPRIPFMATSPDASSARIERLLEFGACDYLLKPFSISTLCGRLEIALRTPHDNN